MKFRLSARWVWQMAWRDARHQRNRLSLMLAALAVGVAAMVLLDLLNSGLQREIHSRARDLLGADMVVNASRKPEPAFQRVLDSLPQPKTETADMASMVMFLPDSTSRLIRLVAYGPGFPFYGKLETEPAQASELLQHGGYALLDESLAVQYGVSAGESLKLGNNVFRISGVVRRQPGGGGVLSTLTPAVYISLADLSRTGLVQFGSRVEYHVYIKTSTVEEAEKLATFLRSLARRYGYGFDDVAEQRRELGRAFESVYRFFSLLAFVALLLGGVGIAASAHLYAAEKRADVAMLRVIGAPGKAAFFIYFFQMLVLGLLGSVFGAGLGLGLYLLTPLVLSDLLPIELNLMISWGALLRGFLLINPFGRVFGLAPYGGAFCTSVGCAPPRLSRGKGAFQSPLNGANYGCCFSLLIGLAANPESNNLFVFYGRPGRGFSLFVCTCADVACAGAKIFSGFGTVCVASCPFGIVSPGQSNRLTYHNAGLKCIFALHHKRHRTKSAEPGGVYRKHQPIEHHHVRYTNPSKRPFG